MANREVEALVRDIRTWPGWRVEDTKKGYIAYPPDRQLPGVTIPKTPSDVRWRRNAVSRLRRSGGPL